MNIVLTGATGFIGKALAKVLASQGHSLIVLTRDPSSAKETLGLPCEYLHWSPEDPSQLTYALKEASALIHLAGESIADKRWSEGQKAKIRNSRVLGTRQLVEAVGKQGKLAVFLSSSAIGYYGDRGDEELNETSGPGNGFLAEVCQQWENETLPLRTLGIREVRVRTGLVLGREGGALKKMVPLFKTGLAGPLGTGQQYYSWIHREDLIQMFLYALENPSAEGPWNAVAPTPVTNQEFTEQLAKALHRPAKIRVPAWALKLGLGEMGEMLTHSQRCLPQAVLGLGFRFRYPKLTDALNDLFAMPRLV